MSWQTVAERGRRERDAYLRDRLKIDRTAAWNGIRAAVAEAFAGVELDFPAAPPDDWRPDSGRFDWDQPVPICPPASIVIQLARNEGRWSVEPWHGEFGVPGLFAVPRPTLRYHGRRVEVVKDVRSAWRVCGTLPEAVDAAYLMSLEWHNLEHDANRVNRRAEGGAA